jgi:hypothetical protein
MIKLAEALSMEPKTLKEQLICRFARTTPGEFYGAQAMLNMVWPVIDAAEELHFILQDVDARKIIDSFTDQPLALALGELKSKVNYE